MVSYITLQDNTRYRQVNDRGTLVRDPLKVNGRDRKHRRKVRGRRIGKPGHAKITAPHTNSVRPLVTRTGWVIH